VRRTPAPFRAALAVAATLAGLAVLAPAALAGSGAAATAGTEAPPATLVVGTQTLTRCAAAPLAYCGSLSVPLDHIRPAGPRISIAYRWYPASSPAAGRAAHTVVPVEGGPGYPSIGSVQEGYAPMYGPLLARWNMLAVDNRGTGHSTPVNCPELQEFSGPTASQAFRQAAAECAASLNSHWHYPGGAPVHASDLFTSSAAAEDLAEVIGALKLGRVDLYGDSYGSFFAQVFAARYPRLIRSLTLDSTYQTVGLDPWYRSSATAMASDLNTVCARSPACESAAPGSSWVHIGELAQSLREHPISGTVPGPDGSAVHVSMDVVGLVDLLNDAAGDHFIYRGLDGAARAVLQEGYDAPLLRLYAQRLKEDEAYFDIPASQYSDGLYLAVSCLDYPQLFEMSASPATRALQLQAAEGALPSSTFSPFSTSEWLSQDQNTEAYSACLDWPSPTVAQPPVTGPEPLLPASMPVLVLGGELDTWTPPGDVPKVLAQIGGHSRFIELANATHVVGEGDTLCGSSLIQQFVSHPAAIDSLNASCAPLVPAIHTVGVYPATLSEQPPIQAAYGNTAGLSALGIAAAAVSTAGDALARYQAIEATKDLGLLAGSVTATRGGDTLTLTGDEMIEGVSVSGTLNLTSAVPAIDGDAVTASLTVSGPGLPGSSLQATWTSAGTGAVASVAGAVGGEAVQGTMPAP
jgi:pimeloyl-ACP methyl ester carboxylesterase